MCGKERGRVGWWKGDETNARTHQLHLAWKTCLLVIDLEPVAVCGQWDGMQLLLLPAPAPQHVSRYQLHTHRVSS